MGQNGYGAKCHAVSFDGGGVWESYVQLLASCILCHAPLLAACVVCHAPPLSICILGTLIKRIGTKHIGDKSYWDKTHQLQNISETKRIGYIIYQRHNVLSTKCIGGQNVLPDKKYGGQKVLADKTYWQIIKHLK